MLLYASSINLNKFKSKFTLKHLEVFGGKKLDLLHPTVS